MRGLPLWTYRDGHLARDSAAYAVAQAHAIGKLRTRGRAVALYEAPDPIVARINENRWIVDCVCGSGCYVDLDAGTPVVARCFYCGAIHTQVVLPANRTALEAVLLRRPRAANRHWQPGETVVALEAENTAHGCD